MPRARAGRPRAVGGDRARPRPPRGAEPHALAASRVLRVLRDHGLGSRDRGGLPRGGLQPGRHPLAHVAGPDGARAGRRAVAARPRGPSLGAGRLRRPARRHGLDGFAHRARGRARAGVPRRPQDGPRGPARAASSTARSSRTLRSTRRASSSGSAPKGCGRSRSDAEFRMDANALESEIAKDRAAGRVPVAVVATAGTTAVTSVDPLPALADVCAARGHLAPRGRGVRGLGRGAAGDAPALRGLGARGLRRLQPAQVDVRADRVHRRFSSAAWSACGARSPSCRTISRRPRDRPCASTWITACSSAGGSAPSRCG